MKIKRHVMSAGLGIFVLVTGVMAQFAMDWSTIDGGGGSSTGGTYAVNGTIGQLDAGDTMSGGNYSLIGGFWAVYAVQAEGAPYLSIIVSGPSEVTISWEPDTTGYVLQQADSLSTNTAWSDALSGPTNPVVIPITQPTTFYRLEQP